MDLQALYSKSKRPYAGENIIFHLPDMGIAKAPFNGRLFIAGTEDGFTPSDHGTMIASILYDWCPKATLISYRVASDIDATLTNGTRLLEAFECIVEEIRRRPGYHHIVSVSQAIGMVGAQLDHWHNLINAIDDFGGLTITGAGNDGGPSMAKYPASWPEPICVVACDNRGVRADFSTVLGEADCCAWGKNVPVIDANGNRTIASGTSFACPNVAGMAGMIWQPGMTADDVWECIKSACVDTGTSGLDPYYGWGVVDPTLLTASTIDKEEDMPTIRLGFRGNAVIKLQQLLIANGANIKADGDFGLKTQAAVKKFQVQNGLVDDGIVGPKTWEKLMPEEDKKEPEVVVIDTPVVNVSCRQQIIDRLLMLANKYIGTNYSQSLRNRIWPGGHMDCSTYVGAMWLAAGFPLLSPTGDILWTSCYEVNAVGFDLIYPDSKSRIGKTLPSPSGLLASGIVQEGDILFWNLNSATTRPNKITHVGLVDKGAKNIIHISNDREKCCHVPFTRYDKQVCAILRLKENIQPMSLPLMDLAIDRPPEVQTKSLQIALNALAGTKLTIDGCYGPATEKAVATFNTRMGIPEGGRCTIETWKALGYIIPNGTPVVEESKSEEEEIELELTKMVTTGEVNFRTGPGTEYNIIATLDEGQTLLSMPAKNNWCNAVILIEDKLVAGYLSANYVK